MQSKRVILPNVNSSITFNGRNYHRGSIRYTRTGAIGSSGVATGETLCYAVCRGA